MNARSFQYIDDDSGSRMVFTTYSNPIDRYYLQEYESSDGFSISVTSSKAVGHLECACSVNVVGRLIYCWVVAFRQHLFQWSNQTTILILPNSEYVHWPLSVLILPRKCINGYDWCRPPLHHGQVLHWIKLLQTKAWDQNLWYHKQIEVYIVVPYVSSTW